MKRAIFLFSILYAFLAGGMSAALAQGEGTSVMIYNKAKPGSKDSETANVVEQRIISGLGDKYPCVDWMNEEVLFGAIQKMREREALTGELDEQALAKLGNAVGARYIIVVTAETLPNGQTVASAKVIDGQAARTVANRLEVSEGGDSANRAAASVAEKILNDLSGAFSGQCDAHWTGTITYSQKTLKQKEATQNLTKVNKIESSNSETYEQTTDVLLQPMSKGGKTNFFTNGQESMMMSRVYRKFTFHMEQIVTESGEEACRRPGANPYRKPFKSIDKKTVDERGENTATLPVAITVFNDTGRFTIKVSSPELPIKRTEERSGVRDFCIPQPFSESKSAERVDTPSFFEFDGRSDPGNPDVLAGKQVTGNLARREYTITWNLRLVTPKKKK